MAELYRGDYSRIALSEFIPPGYKVAHMIATAKGLPSYRITFAISPTSLNESRSNSFQLSKTSAGWFSMRNGPNPTAISIDGYMLDIEGYLEKHQFLDNWNNFIRDKRNSYMEYDNPYTVKLLCMGREYSGTVNSVSFTASAIKPFLHQYQISYTSLSDKYIYKSESQKVSASSSAFAISKPIPRSLSKTVYSILSKG